MLNDCGAQGRQMRGWQGHRGGATWDDAMPKERRRSHAGYTLVEMMFVISTMAIGLAIIGPPVARERQRSQLRRAVTQFESAHALARSVALQYGRVATLRINSRRNNFWVESDTTTALSSASAGRGEAYRSGVREAAGNETVLGGTNRLKDVTIQSDRRVLCFDGRGLPTTVDDCEEPDATVVFQLDGLTRTLEITSLGHIRR